MSERASERASQQASQPVCVETDNVQFVCPSDNPLTGMVGGL